MPQIIALTRTFVLAMTLLLSPALLAAPQTPVGVWKTIDDETGKAKSLVEINERAGVLEGKVIQLFRSHDEEQNPLCSKCTGNRHDQPIIGMTILTGLKKDGDEWNDGQILDPNNGKLYRCKIMLIDGGSKLDVHGFIGISLFGRSQTWERQQQP